MSPVFFELIEELKAQTKNLDQSYKTFDKDQEHNFIDTSQFIKVLYTLFDINGLLINSERINGVDTKVNINESYLPNKFYFTEEFPDDVTKDRDIITFETVRRRPASLGANEKPFEGTKQYRPMLRGVAQNKVHGHQELHMMIMMDNLLRFTCWSTKTSQAQKLARFLEQFIYKYNWFFRKYVPVIVYEGQNTDSRITDKYGPLRYYPVHLDYFIRTAEIFSLSENEVRNIEININEIKTVLAGLE